MRATFLAEAEAELVVAADRYEAANPDLGMNFRRDARRIVALSVCARHLTVDAQQMYSMKPLR